MLNSDQRIKIEEGDSANFIELINKIISITVFQFRIDEICFIKIKNWFDHKWLNYSGISVINFDKGGFGERDAALQFEWREKITVPPFNPNRVIRETFVRKQETGNKLFEKRLHKRKPSNNNIHNRIQIYTQNGLFVWYSSNSKQNKRGSLMVYRVQENHVETWYASLEYRKEWKIIQSKGIELSELKGMAR